jgi:hypothetical protein
MLGISIRSLTATAVLAGNTAMFAVSGPPVQTPAAAHGAGWGDTAVCIGCMAGGIVAVYSGAAAIAVVVAAPAATAAAVMICVAACDAAF